jgi:hypothetical protein
MTNVEPRHRAKSGAVMLTLGLVSAGSTVAVGGGVSHNYLVFGFGIILWLVGLSGQFALAYGVRRSRSST